MIYFVFLVIPYETLNRFISNRSNEIFGLVAEPVASTPGPCEPTLTTFALSAIMESWPASTGAVIGKGQNDG